MSRLRLGTCSWSEKSWVGPFYSAGCKSGEWLSEYARHFDTVEADSTYYACPPAERAARWVQQTPEDFVISCKLPRQGFLGEDARELDAERVLRLEECGPWLASWEKVHAALGAKAGPVVLQFPWLNSRVFRDLSAFLARLEPFLGALPAGARHAVEIRNREYLHPELLATLRKYRVALVLSEVKGMPHPATAAETLELRTADFFYARLIGDRAAVERRSKSFDKLVLDQSQSLGRWAPLLLTMASDADGFVYANNHFEGHGPGTARQLGKMLDSLRASRAAPPADVSAPCDPAAPPA
jgi:uncharacterized protein YecE (DUF72 family)